MAAFWGCGTYRRVGDPPGRVRRPVGGRVAAGEPPGVYVTMDPDGLLVHRAARRQRPAEVLSIWVCHSCDCVPCSGIQTILNYNPQSDWPGSWWTVRGWPVVTVYCLVASGRPAAWLDGWWKEGRGAYPCVSQLYDPCVQTGFTSSDWSRQYTRLTSLLCHLGLCCLCHL